MKILIEDNVSTPVTGEKIATHFPRSFSQREGLTICRAKGEYWTGPRIHTPILNRGDGRLVVSLTPLFNSDDV